MFINKNRKNIVLDIFHNYYEKKIINDEEYIIHRKGASSCFVNKLSIIPGSRGTKTYVVMALKSEIEHGFSMSHGAGRRISRSKAYDTISSLSEDDRDKKIHGNIYPENIIICDDKHLLYEESPFSYKNIDSVINDLEKNGIIKKIFSLKPIITYKMKHKID